MLLKVVYSTRFVDVENKKPLRRICVSLLVRLNWCICFFVLLNAFQTHSNILQQHIILCIILVSYSVVYILISERYCQCE